MDIKSLIDLAKKGTTPSIEKLCDLIRPYTSHVEALSDLYDGLGILKKVVQKLQENDEGFLSCNTEGHQQLLEECRNLLEYSEMNCTGLYDELQGAMRHSAIFSGVDYDEIKRRVGANRFGIAPLRIWTMTLDLLVKTMQL